MRVEMTSHKTGRYFHGESLEKVSPKTTDELNRKFSDDVCSLYSWSENVEVGVEVERLSTSSANSSPASVFPPQQDSSLAGNVGQRQGKVIRARTVNSTSSYSPEREPSPVYHVPNQSGSRNSAGSVTPEKSQTYHTEPKTTRAYSQLDFECEVDNLSIASRQACNIYDYHQEVSTSSMNSQSVLVGVVNAEHTMSRKSVTPSTSNGSQYHDIKPHLKSRPISLEVPHHSKPTAQRLYPDLHPFLDHDQPEKPSASVYTPSYTLISSDSKGGHKPPQTQRPSYFDLKKLPGKYNRNKESHTEDSKLRDHNRQQINPHTSNFLHPSGKASKKNVDKPLSQEQTYNNGAHTLQGRLHRSQPSIANDNHHAKQYKSSSDMESVRLSYEHRLEPENVKTKVKSVWNNIKYGWTFKSKSHVKCDSPLYILGRCYHRQKDDPSTDTEDQFLKDFVSRIWLTYRSNFYPIPGTKLSTDCGWGCMLRSGQMLMAQCLLTHFLGRDWRLYDSQTPSDEIYYREIIRWFSDPIDTPSDKAPFCLHHLANIGRAYNKDPGQWYGPASAAYIFRDALVKARHAVPILNQLSVYVAQDCTVYIEDVIRMCTEPNSPSESWDQTPATSTPAAPGLPEERKWRSLILLIPIRLGGEVMNEIYIPCIQRLLAHENCMGIIGGKPKHSLYFIGYQEDKLIYLDPHLCREAVDTSVSNFRIETYHCMTPRKLSINKMDPSCTVGFYIRKEEEFRKFVEEVKQFVSPPTQQAAYPLFIFTEGHQSDSPSRTQPSGPDRRVKVRHFHADQNGQKQRTLSGESEEFVML